MLVCALFAQICTRDRGCSAHPAFPAPSFGEKTQANLGQIAPREGEVVSMQHTPRRPGLEPGPIRRGLSVRALALDIFCKMTAAAYGSLRSQGRREKLARRFEPLFRQHPHRGIRVHRLSEGEALRVFAAQLVELDRIRVSFRA